MSDINIENVIQINRLPRGWQLVPLCVYFPIGLLLCVIRIFIGLNALLAATILPRMSILRSCVLRTMCLVLGIVVQEENVKDKNRDARVVVSNHLSVLDYLALDLVLPCIMPSIWDLPQLINWCLGYKDFAARRGRNALIENVKKHLQECNCSVLSHPEGIPTNGSVGLLKFSTWPFSLNHPVNPIVLRIFRPTPFNISVSTVESHWWGDIFWFFFTPFTCFTVRYMPEMSKRGDEDDDEFAKRVQEAMAAELSVKATSITSADIKEYVKKNIIASRQIVTTRHSGNTRSDENVEVVRMALQVKEVLPYVPLDVIKRDLVRTGSIDETITNILEGLVPYVPEPPLDRLTATEPSSRNDSDVLNAHLRTSANQSSTEYSQNSTASTSTGFSTGASSFGKTANERMMSFQDRKRVLLDRARSKYMEKYNLQ